jgi:dUTP pyrophosphatase
LNEEIIIERLQPDASIPRRATAGSAGMDLCAYLRNRTITASDGSVQFPRSATEAGESWTFTLQPGEMALIPLGFKTRLPAGIEAQIRPRSGQAFKNALTVPNAPGTIDCDYAEEWMVIVRNDSSVPKTISHGERIAQVVFARYESMPFIEGAVSRTTERSGGFGSTGTTS